MKLALALVLLTFAIASAAHAQRPDAATLQRLLVAEDSRGMGADGTAPITAGLHSTDTAIRRVAVRAAGRLQRPELASDLLPLLNDPVAAIRAEAANALAQSVVNARRRATDPLQGNVRAIATALEDALAREHDGLTGDLIAESLGRLAYADSATARAAESAILHHAATTAGFWTAHGLYWIALNRSTTGGLSAPAITLLRNTAHSAPAAAARRVATLALTTARALDSAAVAGAVDDPDAQVRRLALAGVTVLSPAYRQAVLAKAFADPSPIVRSGAVTAARAGVRIADCSAIVAATTDSHPYVVQMAIDALGAPCADSAAASEALVRALVQARGETAHAHAFVSLARIDPAHARTPLAAFVASANPVLRLSADSAAELVGDTAILYRLVRDPDHNVREGAIAALARLVKHAADSSYIAALASPGYQVVRAAAIALTGSTDAAAVPALLDNLDRLSRERRENSRDPRIAVLARVAALGSQATGARLTPYLADFDSTVADSAAKTLSRWSGTAVMAHPVPLPIAVEPLAATYLAGHTDLRVTMASGDVFTIRMFNTEAPATVARMIKLAQAHYFDGHIFQRVEPNFVVQGGGTDASEYMGDAQFMRDEIAAHSHFRGTLGVSSRGRDTGDAQWFFNLTDNTRLDHEYTVFGEVVSGEDVVERILEGAVIRTVVVVK